MIYYSIIFGLIQALTEFLPVSSSGHLLLLHNILNFSFGQNLTYDCALHLGTGLALLLYFWSDIKKYGGALLRFVFNQETKDKQSLKTSFNIFFAVIPAGIIGLTLENFIENKLRGVAIVVAMLVIVAILFFVAEKFCRDKKGLEQLSARQALGIGFSQALALIPGVSRSGISIVTSMAYGLNREQAAKFSFLVGLPVILGAGIYKMLKIDFSALNNEIMLIFVLGLLTSSVAGYLVIRFLMKYLQNYSLKVFAWYRIALAIVIIIYFWLK
jgi:undecaprenyl-diphosphatase